MTESIERCDFQIKLTLFYFCFVFVLSYPSSTIGFNMVIKYSGLAIGFGPFLGENLWQLSRLA